MFINAHLHTWTPQNYSKLKIGGAALKEKNSSDSSDPAPKGAGFIQRKELKRLNECIDWR